VLEYIVKHKNNRIYQTPVFSVCCMGVSSLEVSSCISKSQVQSSAPYIDATMSEVNRVMESSFIPVLRLIFIFACPEYFNELLNMCGDAGCLEHVFKVNQSCPRNSPWRPIGLWDVKVPTLSTQSVHRWR
jgi:hypothetical protein